MGIWYFGLCRWIHTNAAVQPPPQVAERSVVTAAELSGAECGAIAAGRGRVFADLYMHRSLQTDAAVAAHVALKQRPGGAQARRCGGYSYRRNVQL